MPVLVVQIYVLVRFVFLQNLFWMKKIKFRDEVKWCAEKNI